MPWTSSRRPAANSPLEEGLAALLGQALLLRLSFGERLDQLVGKKGIAAAIAMVHEHLVLGKLLGPGEKRQTWVELGELLPQGNGRALEDLLRIVQTAYQWSHKTQQLGLVLHKQLHKQDGIMFTHRTPLSCPSTQHCLRPSRLLQSNLHGCRESAVRFLFCPARFHPALGTSIISTWGLTI